jgi:membrane fusion protein (multidrug efflux system)
MHADRRATFAAVAATVALHASCEKPKPAAPPPPEVYVAPVVQQDVPVYLDLVGQTQGYQDIEIRARVEGFVKSVNFEDGSFVRKGDLLYQIDPQPLQAVLVQAKADQATAEARLEKATNDVARYTPLAAKQAVSQKELDDALAQRDAARSQVEAARAMVEKAALDVGYARVTSPIDGLAGTTLVKPGALVGRGENTLMTTVSSIDPIIFRTAVTEADYLRMVRRRPVGGGGTPARRDIQLTLADGTVYPQPGRLTTIDRAVNPTTGTLGVQMLFANPGSVLRPGQYGRARVLVDTKANALLVPQRAVQELQNLHSVAVVDAENKVGFRNVTVGPRVDTLWVIEKGLKPGDEVVTEGLQTLADGMTVRATPAEPGSEPVSTTGHDNEAK